MMGLTVKKILGWCFAIIGLNIGYGQVPKLAEAILVVVGDKMVLLSDFESDVNQLKLQFQQDLDEQTRCEVLKQIIIKKMMINQAELDSLPVTDERIDAEIENRLRYFMRQAGSQKELEKYLGKSLAEYKDEIRPKMKEELLSREMEAKITENVKISPREVKAFYDSLPVDSLPTIPVEVEVAQMFIEPKVSQIAKDFAKANLEELRMRILKGESFEKLARGYSQDPGSKVQGGLLPEFGRGDMVPEFERMAFKLKPDSVSQVFESPFGYHIIKLESRKGERMICRHILIRPDYTSSDYEAASKKADSIYQKLINNKIDFCNAVKTYSDNEATSKGFCGFFTDENTGGQKVLLDAIPADLKLVIDALKPGQYSAPELINTEDGRQVFRIVYLKVLTQPHQANIDQDYDRIQIEALNAKKAKAVNKWVEKVRKETYIKVNTDIFDCPSLNSWNNRI